MSRAAAPVSFVTSRRPQLRLPADGRERERDRHRAEPEREGADVEPGVAAEAVEDPAAGERTERHAEARHHGRRAQYRAHDLLREVFARKDSIERHHAAVSEAE